MKNTGITYTSAERSPVILPEMAELLPPLSAEQLDALEADLIKNGCYSPIIVNEDMVIIDGHNRQALCEKHGLPYAAKLLPADPCHFRPTLPGAWIVRHRAGRACQVGQLH